MIDDAPHESDCSLLTQLIRCAADGDTDARESLYESVLENLRHSARRALRRHHNHEFQTTALVNEVVVRFEKSDALRDIANRRVFFSIATLRHE